MTERETTSIIVEHELTAPPAKVWRALTDSKLVASWLMDNDLQPIVGHRFNFRARPMPGWDGIVHCEVIAVDVERTLAYAWRGGSDEPAHRAQRLDTVVTWTLAPTPSGGTRLRLEHSGFTANNAFAFDAMTKGWTEMVERKIAAAIAAHA